MSLNEAMWNSIPLWRIRKSKVSARIFVLSFPSCFRAKNLVAVLKSRSGIVRGLEDCIVRFLNSTISRDDNKQRDISLILSYYGFGDTVLPTLEALAEQFKINSRQRVQQIIRDKFLAEEAARKLDCVRVCADQITSVASSMASTALQKLIEGGVLSESHHPADICRLMEDLELIKDFNIYTPDLQKVTRNNASKYSDFVLTGQDELTVLSEHMKNVVRLPSSLGAMSVSALKLSSTYSSLFKIMIANMPGSWTFEQDGDLWFLFESRENRLFNLMSKTFQLGARCPTDRLTDTIHNALYRLTPTKGYGFPPRSIVREYIASSKFTSINGEDVSFGGELAVLSNIERDIQSFFEDQTEADYPTIRKHLLNKGHSEPLIVKAVNNSPLVFVDKSGGRKKHIYSPAILIKQSAEDSDSSWSRYDSFRDRLKRLARTGTDEDVTTLGRREQAVLSEWLFGHKEQASCALCGQTFEVKALVCAHKKRRSTCSESERTDPFIVMPLCLFGCDYLYEHRHCRIRDGIVVLGNPLDSGCRSADVLTSIVGREIDSEWTKGPSAYFL